MPECGGIQGVQCDMGMTCILSSSAADATGVCRQTVAASGQQCGGIMGAHCASGLQCVTSAADNTADASGICRKVAKLGGSCAGNVTEPFACPKGLTCVSKVHDGYMAVDLLPQAQKDHGGVCLKLALTNDNCGGNVKFAPVCQVGLVCKPRRHQTLPVQQVGGICLTDL
ncbi:hypothetical protein HK101_005053 [Irineochytrium annulatum]|nr:hypothetical protein HK101_005053 [Irineochytrium annulatum]